MIYNEMIKNASESLLGDILDAINLIWRVGDVPGSWKRAIIFPIPKTGKPPEMATSCLAKLMERMVVSRLSFFQESKCLLSPFQSGFQANRSTADPLCRLVADGHEGFHESKPHGGT